MDNDEIYKLLARFINNLIPLNDQNNPSKNSQDLAINGQLVEINSSSSSTLVVINFLEQICKLLKKNIISPHDLCFAFNEHYCKLNLVDDPCQLIAIGKLTKQFQVLYQLLNERLPISDIIKNPSISVSQPRYHSDFVELKFIASGGFGTVYKVRHRLDDHEYAVKKVCVTLDKVHKIIKILDEVKTLAKLNHTNVISYKNAWIEEGYSTINVPNITESQVSSDFSKNNNSDRLLSSSSLPGSLNISSRKFKIRSFNEPGCSTDIYTNSNSNCNGNDSVHHNRLLNSSVIVEEVINSNNTNNVSNCNSSDTIDSFVSFRNDNDNDNDNNDGNHYNYNSNSYSTGSDIEEIDEEENNSGVEEICNRQVCEYKSRPDVVTLYIQMALCEQSLRKWLDSRKNQISPVSTITGIFMQILKGLEYIHSHGIIHHDIKPCNIFISTSKLPHIQIGDFGLACLVKKENGHTVPFGTEMYAAPEQLSGSCDPKSDLYSLGIILMELLYPTRTFMELDNTLKLLKLGKIPDTLEKRYQKYGEIIIQLLAPDPKERPSSSELLQELKDNKDFIIDRLEEEIIEKDEAIRELKILNQILLSQLLKVKINNNPKLKRQNIKIKVRYFDKK
ncbi:eukaryotic translation initiation factor 2-alpha kinase 1 [Microplitis demolitor]|uniref:eukaryotic translation initiation factor 2-alpha kinase 1 n=1 Tax=Microplitis demolitor TaxID=69319 RepID=UPI0004CCD5CF|nr:eukaryotic translation initiation factor 2-alpha kinase 1 [Microplitis demolitor]